MLIAPPRWATTPRLFLRTMNNNMCLLEVCQLGVVRMYDTQWNEIMKERRRWKVNATTPAMEIPRVKVAAKKPTLEIWMGQRKRPTSSQDK